MDIEDEAGLGSVPLTRETWMTLSWEQEAGRRRPAAWEAPALARLPHLCERLNLPLHLAEWHPGDCLWWPESESGRVTVWASHDDMACLLLDRVTGYWRLRVIGPVGSPPPVLSRQEGLTVTALVATRLGCEPDAAADLLARWFPAPRANRRVA